MPLIVEEERKSWEQLSAIYVAARQDMMSRAEEATTNQERNHQPNVCTRLEMITKVQYINLEPSQ